MIDIHTHLCWKSYDRDREEIIARCKKELAAVIVSSARYDEGLKVLDLVSKHPDFLFPTLGFHPTEGGNSPERIIELIKSNSEKIAGVGEAGMDFHFEKNLENREKQKEVFLKFIDLAESVKKPLVIHSWDAERHCFDLVKNRDVEVIFHCYSGNRELAEEIIKNGFFISVSTQVLFSKNIRKIAKILPNEQLLLETDSPFLSPDREKDKRNYPWNIKLSAEKIAEIRNTKTEDVLELAKNNAVRAFGLKI